MLAQTMSSRVTTSPVSTARPPTTGPDTGDGRRDRLASLTVRARGCPERPVQLSGYD